MKCYGKHTVEKQLAVLWYWWWKIFKVGNMPVTGAVRSGRPSSAVTDTNIVKAAEMLQYGIRITLGKRSASLGFSFE